MKIDKQAFKDYAKQKRNRKDICIGKKADFEAPIPESAKEYMRRKPYDYKYITH